MNATTNKSKIKTAAELSQGDVINPPLAERVWLWRDGIKRQYTVSHIGEGKKTKKGKFVRVYYSVPSPYRNEEPSKSSCEFLESKMIQVFI